MKNEFAACKIARYRKVQFIEIGRSKVNSMGVGVGAFEAMGTYPVNCNKVPEYLFSNSDISEYINPMGTSLQLYQNAISIPVEK